MHVVFWSFMHSFVFCYFTLCFSFSLHFALLNFLFIFYLKCWFYFVFCYRILYSIFLLFILFVFCFFLCIYSICSFIADLFNISRFFNLKNLISLQTSNKCFSTFFICILLFLISLFNFIVPFTLKNFNIHTKKLNGNR